MVELDGDRLVFSFPEVHEGARLEITLQRTLRIPDDGRTYPLPPGLGALPLRHVDDFAAKVPPSWREHGGVMLPLYQAEATWLSFRVPVVERSGTLYPMAVKVAAGKINAVTGHTWTDRPHENPQDYMVVPNQPWLDGFVVGRGIIRQFVAMPLGAGFSAEEQVTGAAEHGGLQLVVHPMRREAFERLFGASAVKRSYERDMVTGTPPARLFFRRKEQGLAPGGRMRQRIHKDRYGVEAWDVGVRGRCFVHLLNSEAWRAVTGSAPPHRPPTAKEYTEAGLPWFEHYAPGEDAVPGSSTLASLKSVEQKKAEAAAWEAANEPVEPRAVKKIQAGGGPKKVRDGSF